LHWGCVRQAADLPAAVGGEVHDSEVLRGEFKGDQALIPAGEGDLSAAQQWGYRFLGPRGARGNGACRERWEGEDCQGLEEHGRARQGGCRFDAELDGSSGLKREGSWTENAAQLEFDWRKVDVRVKVEKRSNQVRVESERTQSITRAIEL